MVSKNRTGKNTNGPNQRPSQEVKDSTTTSKKPLDFPTFEFSRRYPPQIPSQAIPNPTYTSSLDTLDPHQDSSLNEELRGVTPEDPLYQIPNTELDHLHCHT